MHSFIGLSGPTTRDENQKTRGLIGSFSSSHMRRKKMRGLWRLNPASLILEGKMKIEVDFGDKPSHLFLILR